ncbi:MAG: FG-GAP repeat protein, partial [Anaerolineae bacterium]
MKSERRSVRKHILVSLTLILALLFVTPGVAPAQERARVDQPDAGITAPAGLTAGEQATILDMIREAEYQFAWQVNDDGEWAYRAPNRANDLSLSLATDGFHAARYGAKGEILWDFGLSLAAYGDPFGPAQDKQTFPCAVARDSLIGDRERVEYHWSQDVVEWYTNSAAGVEHGLTLAAPPAGADGSAVELTFALRGSLAPELDGDGGALRLKDASGETVLRYDQLAVYDATGRALPIHMRLTEGPQSAHLHLVVDTASAVYPLTVDPVLHGQAAKLTASDTEDGDDFGFSVAVSGDIVVVGAPYEDGSFMGSDRGGAYLFERNKLGTDYWGEVKKLDIIDPTGGALFGFSVAVSGNTIVVGAPKKDYVGGTGCATGPECGAAYIFERNLGGPDYWGMVTRIQADDADDYDRFGWSVAIHNDTAIVGAPYADGIGQDSGAAYVFERNQGGADAWGQVELLTPATVGALQFGHSVGISGDTAVVGAWQTVWGGGSGRGAAHIFYRNKLGADSWGAVATLTASDGEDEDQFGNAVAISGDTVVV